MRYRSARTRAFQLYDTRGYTPALYSGRTSPTSVLALTLILILIASACGGQTATDGRAVDQLPAATPDVPIASPTSLPPEPSVETLAPRPAPGYVLEGADGYFVYNVGAIVEGRAFELAYDQYQDDYGFLEDLGFRIDELDHLVTGGPSQSRWVIASGNLDHKDIRNSLERQGVEEAEYMGRPLWSDPSASVALLEDHRIALHGPEEWVRRTVRAVDDGTGLLSADSPLRRTAEEVDSWFVGVKRQCPWDQRTGCQAIATGGITDSEEFGQVMATSVLFGSGPGARNMLDAVVFYLNGTWAWHVHRASVDGEYVIAYMAPPQENTAEPSPVAASDIPAAPTEPPAKTTDQAPEHTPTPIATPAPAPAPQPPVSTATAVPTVEPTASPVPAVTSTPLPTPTSAPTPLPKGGEPMDYVLADTRSLAVFDARRAVTEGEASANQVEWYREGLRFQLSSLGIAVEQVELAVSEPDLYADYRWWSVKKGIFDYEAIRTTLGETGYTQEWFRDYEVWSTETGYGSANRSVALLEAERIVIYGDFRWVEETLKAASRDAGILDDTMPMRRAMDRAGAGWYVAAYTWCGSADCEAQAVSANPAPEPPYSARVTWATLFADDERGQREAELYTSYFENGVVEGQFVVFEEIVDEDDFNRYDWPR